MLINPVVISENGCLFVFSLQADHKNIKDNYPEWIK